MIHFLGIPMMHPWQAAKEALAAGSAGDVTVGEAMFFFWEKKGRTKNLQGKTHFQQKR